MLNRACVFPMNVIKAAMKTAIRVRYARAYSHSILNGSLLEMDKG